MGRHFIALLAISAAFAVAPSFAVGQTDELRAATGLPIKIGEPAIWGKVFLKKLPDNERKPSVFVSLIEGGTLIERVSVDNSGYYLFRRSVRGLATLLLEVENNEVGRIPVSVGGSVQIRQDFEVDWLEVKRLGSPGVVSARDSYSRGPEAAKHFDAAMRLIKEKNLGKAASELKNAIAKDPKDHVAWTELGTVYFKQDDLNNAEACYFKAIQLKSDYFIALLNLGKLYISKNKPDDAVLVLSNAVKADGSSPDGQHYLGEAYLMGKKGSLAVVHLNEAIELAPQEKAEIHLRLAALYDGARMKDKASMEYRAFLAKKPDYPEKEKLEKYIADNPPK